MAPEWTSALLTIGARAVELLLVEEAVQSNLRQVLVPPEPRLGFLCRPLPCVPKRGTLLSLCSLVAE